MTSFTELPTASAVSLATVSAFSAAGLIASAACPTASPIFAPVFPLLKSQMPAPIRAVPSTATVASIPFEVPFLLSSSAISSPCPEKATVSAFGVFSKLTLGNVWMNSFINSSCGNCRTPFLSPTTVTTPLFFVA